MNDSEAPMFGGMNPQTVETHSAVLFFLGDSTYKLRKPLDLGFLDHRSIDARRTVSHREVDLNRRLSPDVYHGVVEVRDESGTPCDYLVHMRRLPAERRLSRLVAEGSTIVDLDAAIDSIAAQLAALHAASPHNAAIDAVGSPASLASLWQESLDHLASLEVGQDAGIVLDDVSVLARHYLAGREALLHQRIADGRIVDGHGDLMADDIFCLDDYPRIIDCLEFSDRLRYGDGILDLAFLIMNLLRLGSPALAQRLLSAYRRAASDDVPLSLVWHYAAYRALVRAKVTAIRAEQEEGEASLAAAREAVDLLSWTADALMAGRVRLILVGGVSGSGKSVLSAQLGAAFAATVIRSDELRNEHTTVLSADPEQRYSFESRSAVYREMVDEAMSLLRAGQSVVLDATWLSPAHRAIAASAATDCAVELVEIECTAARDELARRIDHRARTEADPSEATIEVLDAQLAVRLPWPEAVVVDTSAVDVRDSAAVAEWIHREPGIGPIVAFTWPDSEQ